MTPTLEFPEIYIYILKPGSKHEMRQNPDQKAHEIHIKSHEIQISIDFSAPPGGTQRPR